MKYIKMLGLLAVAAAAMMAFAASASAIVVTEKAGDPIDVNDIIVATSTHTQLTGSVTLTCTHSEVEGTVTQAGGGSPTQDVKGNITRLTWGSGGECGTNTITTVVKGELTLEYESKDSGTLFSYGTEVTALTHNILGTVHCIYRTASTVQGGTYIGTVKDKTLTISSAPIPEVATDTFACKDDAVWHGDYEVKTPTGWDID